jgi:glycosyltransferase involved in cell wall biosynthesis
MEARTIDISIVSPIYRAEKILPELLRQITDAMRSCKLSYEIVLVNDASPDASWPVMQSLIAEYPTLRIINLSRNFGQHYAIKAGVDNASGEYVVVMDCDLQDNPYEIVTLYNKAKCGFDIVSARRVKREDGFLKRVTSKMFFSFYSYWTETNIDGSIGNFAIYHHKVIDAYKQISERGQSLVLFTRWLGFSQESIEVKHQKRFEGKTSYNFSKLIDLAIENIISQSNKPLRISIKFGFLMTFLSFAYGVYLIIRKFMFDIPMGWTSIMVAIFFLAGLVFANLGLLGLYIGRIFDEAKERPLYIIKDKKGW